MGLNELSGVLWRERRLLELLLFKLDEQRLILAGGRTQWLGHATQEIENVLEQLRGVELGLAVEVQDAALALDLEPDCSLGELADRAPAPWDDLLRDHHGATVALVEEIRALGAVNRDLLATSHRAVQEALAAFGEAVPGGDAADGAAAGEAPLLDRAL